MGTPPNPWTQGQKIGFRFFCSFFLIYIFPFPLNFPSFFIYDDPIFPSFLRSFIKIYDYYPLLWHKAVPWFATHVLHLKQEITIFENGSGDTTFNYVQLLLFVLLSVLATILWTLMDRRRPSYRQALYWLRVLVRYNLGAFMLIYGFQKVYHLQMPGPLLSQLIQRYGDKSPMGLAWSFIGFSPGFSAFTGWGEIVGGTLLFFRRTTTAGALILVAVLANVVAINFFYDVPVKLFSSVLLLMDIFLLAPWAGSLVDLFWKNRLPVSLFREKRWVPRFTGRLLPFAKWVFLILIFWGNIYAARKMDQVYGDRRVKPKYWGLYSVKTFVRNKDTVPPLQTDSLRWKYIAIDYDDFARIQMMNESNTGFALKADSNSSHLTLISNSDSTLSFSGQVHRVDSVHFKLSGKLRSDSVTLDLLKIDPQSFTLTGRGFHWINEYPFHR